MGMTSGFAGNGGRRVTALSGTVVAGYWFMLMELIRYLRTLGRSDWRCVLRGAQDDQLNLTVMLGDALLWELPVSDAVEAVGVALRLETMMITEWPFGIPGGWLHAGDAQSPPQNQFDPQSLVSALSAQ
jgi:hypothetical protein